MAQLTQAWRQATQQLEKREIDWQNEETAFNEYFATEHNRLLALWREVVGLRRAFAELRHQTARDFTQVNFSFSTPSSHAFPLNAQVSLFIVISFIHFFACDPTVSSLILYLELQYLDH